MGITALLLPKSWLAAEKMETNSKSNQVGSGGALVAKLCLTLATLWTVASQAPLSMGFPRQEYWSELLCPPPRDLPDSRIETASLRSPALSGRFFTSSTTREAHVSITFSKISEDFPLILNLEKITKEQTLTLLDPFL